MASRGWRQRRSKKIVERSYVDLEVAGLAIESLLTGGDELEAAAGAQLIAEAILHVRAVCIGLSKAKPKKTHGRR